MHIDRSTPRSLTADVATRPMAPLADLQRARQARVAQRRWHALLAVVMTLLISPVAAIASEALDDLLHLVGDDVGVCVEATDLVEQHRQWSKSTIAQRLHKSLLFHKWLSSPEFRHLERAQSTIEALSHKPFDEFAEDLLGSAVVMAVYPQSEAEPTVVFLTLARNEDALSSAIEVWNQAEPHTTLRKEYHGFSYFERTKTDGDRAVDKPVYYATIEARLVLSDRDEMIQKTIDLYRNSRSASDAGAADAPQEPGSLFASPKYQQARTSLKTGTVMSAYFNPRAWDGEMDADWTQTNGDHHGFAAFWQRCDSVVVGLRVSDGLLLETLVHFDRSKPSRRWTELVQSTNAVRSSYLDRVPGEALGMAAGHINFRPFVRPIATSLSEQGGKKWQRARQVIRGLLLGLDPLEDVLPTLGPNWAAFVVPRDEFAADTIPVEGLLAIGCSPSDTDSPQGETDVKSGLDNAMKTGVNVLAAAYNSKAPAVPAVVRSRDEGEVVIRWIENLGADAPAYAITPGEIVLASNPQLIREFLESRSQPSAATNPQFESLSNRFFPDANHVLYSDVAATRRFLVGYRGFLLAQGHQRHHTDELAEHLADLNDVLAMFDGAFLAAQLEETHIRFIGGAVAQSEIPAEAGAN